MRIFKCRVLLFWLLRVWLAFFVLTGTGFAQTAKQELPAIRIEKDNWRVLFQNFTAAQNFVSGQDPRSSLIGQIPGVLAKSLRELTEHVLSDEEKRGLRERAIEEELYKQYREYNDLVSQRDREALSQKKRLGLRQNYSRNDAKIRAKNRLIQRVQNIERESIAVPGALPLLLEDQSDSAYQNYKLVLLEKDYDVLIWGVIGGRRAAARLELRAYMPSLKKEILLWQGIIGRSNYDAALEQLRFRVLSLLLGRPWALLDIAVQTGNGSDAKIYLDGRLEAENRLTIYHLYPEKTYEIEIVAEGLEGKRVFVELEAAKRNRFSLELNTEIAPKFIQVDASSPASVYLGVRYIGQTPVQIPLPAYDTLLVLVAPEKQTLNYDLSPQQENDLFFKLEAAPELTLKQENERRRKRFYWSSGLFTISLAIPLLSSGIAAVNQGLYINNRTNSDGPGYRQSMYIAIGTAIGGALLSGALLGLNIYDFTRYSQSTRALATIDFGPRKVPPEEAEVQKNVSAEQNPKKSLGENNGKNSGESSGKQALP